MIQYTTQQNAALQSIREFLDGKQSVFMLKGYAGTGKTTLISAIVNLIKERNRSYYLMAPTGRAAKILAGKTGELTSTIHRGIYELSKIEVVYGNEEEESSVKYRFPLKKGQLQKNPGTATAPSQSVIVVDEASMVSSKMANNDLFIFGSGILLDDLIEFAALDKGGKIVFIGDPAQLPPVGDSDSMALNPDYFESKGISALSCELTDIIRQDADSAILSNSIKLRDCINASIRTELVLERKTGEVEDIDFFDIPRKIYQTAPRPTIDSPVVICYSNRAVSSYNAQIRQLYFPGTDCSVKVGDKLIIVGNNYSIPGRDLFNGEFATVLDFSDKTEKLTGVVYVKEGEGKKIKKSVVLVFRDITLELEDGMVIKTKVFDDLLSNAQPNLTYFEICALMSNFKMRYPHLHPKSPEYAQILKTDPFYNAVRAKYGYAITCHKSQGGEWSTTFVDFTGRVGLSKDSLRWSYTALTRASHKLFGYGLHNIPPYKAKVVDIASASNVPADFYPSKDSVPAGPFHTEDMSSSLKSMYWQVSDALQGSGYRIIDIEHKQYREVYSISDDEGKLYPCESIYNGAGVMRPFKEVTPGTVPNGLIRLLNSTEDYPFIVDYKTNNSNLEGFYNRILSICSDFGITLINIIDQTANYKIIYCLKTDALFAYLDVFINRYGQITYIAPKSEQGKQDQKLAQLVEAIRK